MNFLSLRNELGTWTLNSDEKLYRAIKQLSETVLEAQKLILNNIQTTRYQVTRGNIQSGCSYNHYLRISETKFTENKIGQKRPQEKKQNNEAKAEPKNKMDVFKQAIDIGTKNLEITEEKGADNDLISVSDTSLSQSIYKDCRVPAFYGTKQFAANSFLNLFTDTQLNAVVPCQKFETNELVVNTQLQQSLMPPPPSLDAILNQNGNLPPPPPPLDLPPPPPLTNTLPSIPPLNNLPPPPSLDLPPLNSSGLPIIPPFSPPVLDAPPRIADSSNFPEHDYNSNVSLAPPSIPKPTKPLSVQEQLALRLKHGKDYKKQIQIKEPPVPVSQPLTIKAQQQNNNRLQEILEQRESVESNIRGSFRNSYGINMNPLVNPIPPIVKPQQKQEQEQQQDTFFGPSRNKTRDIKRAVNLENDIMKRQTFNQDLLFKKKPQPEKKQVQISNNALFIEGSDDQSESLAFKKKDDKAKPLNLPPPPAVQKQLPKKGKNKLLDPDSDQDTSNLFKNSNKPQQSALSQPLPPSSQPQQTQNQPPLTPKLVQSPVSQKKSLNPLFQPSESKAPIEVKAVEVSQTISTSSKKTSQHSQQQENNGQSQRDDDQQSETSRRASNYAMRAAAAGGFGMMSTLFHIPKDMTLTKPSEMKKNQEAHEKMKKQQEQERKARQQESRRLQQERKQQQQRKAEEQRKLLLQEEQKRKKQQLVSEQVQKLPPLPTISAPKQTSHKSKNNSLFDDQQDDDFFKSKPKKFTQHSQLAPSQSTQPKVQNLRQTEYAPIKEQAVKLPNIPKQPQKTEINVSTDRALNIRRKKTKPTMNSQQLFGGGEQEVIKSVPVTTKQQVKILEPPVENVVVETKSSPLLYAQKMSGAGGLGGPQMPLIPKGIISINPAQARTLQKVKREQEQQQKRKAHQRQMQQQRQRQQEQKRKQQQIHRQRLIEEEKRKREQQENRRREQEYRRQQQQNRRRQEQENRRRQQEEEYRRQQQQLRRRQEEEIRRRQQEQARALQEQRRRQQQYRRQEEERQERLRQQQRQREQQERRRIQQSKKQPLVNQKAPFLPKLPSRGPPLGPLGGGSTLPKLPSKPAQTKPIAQKKILFGDDDDQPELNFSKSSKPATNVLSKPTPPVTNTASIGQKKKTLFDDDNDLEDNFFTSKKPAARKQQPLPKSKLNDDQDDIGFTLGKQKQQLIPQEPIKQAFKPAQQTQPAKRKGLLDDDDDDDFGSFKPAAKKAELVSTPTNFNPPPQSSPVVQQKQAPILSQKPAPVQKRKDLFHDDDDDDIGFSLGAKKPQQNVAQPPPKQQPVTNSTSTQNRRNLFADSDSDGDSLATNQKKKGAAKKI